MAGVLPLVQVNSKEDDRKQLNSLSLELFLHFLSKLRTMVQSLLSKCNSENNPEPSKIKNVGPSIHSWLLIMSNVAWITKLQRRHCMISSTNFTPRGCPAFDNVNEWNKINHSLWENPSEFARNTWCVISIVIHKLLACLYFHSMSLVVFIIIKYTM